MTPDIINPGIQGAQLEYNTENQTTEWINMFASGPKYREGILRFPLRKNNSLQGRMRGTWLKMRLRLWSTDKFNIFAILAKYRKSYN